MLIRVEWDCGSQPGKYKRKICQFCTPIRIGRMQNSARFLRCFDVGTRKSLGQNWAIYLIASWRCTREDEIDNKALKTTTWGSKCDEMS